MGQLSHWTAFAVIGLGTLLGPLDSAVNIAFPAITQGFNIPLSGIQWVIICYVLTYASLMLVFGRLGDQFGYLRIFRLGLAVSCVAFIALGLSRAFEWLLFFRILQGVGTAMVISCGPALTTALFSEAQRPKILAAYTLVLGLGSLIGPTFGGLLVEFMGWSGVFWFRFPLAFIALLASFSLKPVAQVKADGSFDLMGAGFLIVSLALVLFGFQQLRAPLFGEIGLILISLICLLSVIAFIRRALRSPAPILDLRLFLNIDFSIINLCNILLNCIGFSVFLLVPFYLAKETNLPVAFAGLVLAISPLGMVIGARLGGLLLTSQGANRVAFLGMTCVGVGVASISWWPSQAAISMIGASLILQGMGMGLFQVACLEFVVARVPKVNRGVAGSLVMVTRTLGIALGASLLTLYFSIQVDNATAAGGTETFLSGFQTSFLHAGVFLLLFLGATCLRRGLWFRGPQVQSS